MSRFQPPPLDPKPKMTIQWQSDDTLTDALVTWLTEHPPNYCILFYSDGKKSLDSNMSDRPSGKDKSQIYAVITQVIFENHPKYGSEYANGQKKFRNSVNNCITSLKNKYKPLKAKFSATGAGVVPLDDASAKNLQEEVCCEFPWYKELDAIWHLNPSFAAKTTSSKPGVDHASDIRQPTDLQIDPCLRGPTGPSAPPALISSTPSPPAFSTPPVPPNADSDINMDPDPLLDNDDDDDLYSSTFRSPLGDALDHLHEDDMDTDTPHHIFNLNSPLKVAGKKQQLTSSPSPPPDPPTPFTIPLKSATPFYDSHAVFVAQGSSGHNARRKPSSIASSSLGMTRSSSTPSLTTHNTSLSDFPASPTSWTSVSGPSAGSRKKKVKSDIQEQVKRVNDEIESLHSDVASRHSFKHKCFLMKLDMKDYHQEMKKYDYLCEARTHEAMQAATSHQRKQEAKDAKIHLHETDIRVHEAQALALDKEVEMWRLKIQFHQMTQSGSKASASGGT
ncbi:hypothetical protein EDD22DRAFT_960136 [Suillus occidentalis]|nr:hypothetical protein EDD22DRAFT_960136 [Suillus occidentalis]